MAPRVANWRPLAPHNDRVARSSALRDQVEADQQVMQLPLHLVQPSSTNPRRDMGAIDELAESLRAHGLLQPVIVRPRARFYELIAGHRRLAAAQRLGWKTIPALVRAADAKQGDVLQMVENLQRQDLSPEEEAAGLAGLMRRNGWSTREVAHAIKRSQTYVSKRVRVYEDPVLRRAVLDGGLPPSAAEELLPLEAVDRAVLAERAVREGWGVSELREAVRAGSGAATRPDSVDDADEDEPVALVVRLSERQTAAGPRRPRGFTTMLKVLRAVVRRILPQDLTEADRRELRLLFMDLSLLAKADPVKREIILPPLEAVPGRR